MLFVLSFTGPFTSPVTFWFLTTVILVVTYHIIMWISKGLAKGQVKLMDVINVFNMS